MEKLGLLEKPELELEEVGTPLDFNWENCKLETVSFGHGITTTLCKRQQHAAIQWWISNKTYAET